MSDGGNRSGGRSLREQIAYDPVTGAFTRLIDRPHSPAGSRADERLDTGGYRLVNAAGKRFRAQRLAWLFMCGEMPDCDIDHRDHDRTNNAISNLRLATRQLNTGNSKRSRANTTGFKGVHKYRRTGKYSAGITVCGKRRHLGYFDTPEVAHAAYMQAAAEHFGEFACGG